MAFFLTELNARLKDDESIWVLKSPLIYVSDILPDGPKRIVVPSGFETDFASVPRLPLFYWLFGDRAHRESVLHDYLYRRDSVPQATYEQANAVFLEAMALRGKPVYVRYPMWWGVCLGGRMAFHQRKVGDRL